MLPSGLVAVTTKRSPFFTQRVPTASVRLLSGWCPVVSGCCPVVLTRHDLLADSCRLSARNLKYCI